MRITYGNKDIEIPVSGSEFYRLLYIIKERCPGRRYDAITRTWFVPANYQSYDALKTILPADVRKDIVKKFKESFARLEAMKFLKGYQMESVKEMIRGKKLVSLPVGSGKTIVALAYYKMFDMGSAIFVVPNPLKKQ